jgi:hypothetical protein
MMHRAIGKVSTDATKGPKSATKPDSVRKRSVDLGAKRRKPAKALTLYWQLTQKLNQQVADISVRRVAIIFIATCSVDTVFEGLREQAPRLDLQNSVCALSKLAVVGN